VKANTLIIKEKVIVELLLQRIEEDVLPFSEGIASYKIIDIPL
jgi:sporulation protein YlmC with PRC-barrel domain